MKLSLAFFFFLFGALVGCASSAASKCQSWKYDKTNYSLGMGYTYKSDQYHCVQFSE